MSDEKSQRPAESCPRCNTGTLRPLISDDGTAWEADKCDGCGASRWFQVPKNPPAAKDIQIVVDPSMGPDEWRLAIIPREPERALQALIDIACLVGVLFAIVERADLQRYLGVALRTIEEQSVEVERLHVDLANQRTMERLDRGELGRLRPLVEAAITWRKPLPRAEDIESTVNLSDDDKALVRAVDALEAKAGAACS